MEVAVIITGYNDEEVISRSVGSVLGQNLKSFELIVVDDGSSDDTVKVVRQAVPDLTLVRQPHRGVSAARNAGLRLVDPDAKYIAFLDSDDEWDIAFVRKMAYALKSAEPEVGLAYCSTERFMDGKEVETMSPKYSWKNLISGWGMIATGAYMFRKEVVDKVGPWNEELVRGEDLEWMWRIGLYYDFAQVPEILHKYNQTKSGALNTTPVDEDHLNCLREKYLKLRGPDDPRL